MRKVAILSRDKVLGYVAHPAEPPVESGGIVMWDSAGKKTASAKADLIKQIRKDGFRVKS